MILIIIQIMTYVLKEDLSKQQRYKIDNQLF